MTRILFAAAVLLVSQNLFAQKRSAGALSTKTEKKVFIGELKEGFHFNDKAPNELRVDDESVKPKLLRPRRIEFDLPAIGERRSAMLYVCDDAVTFCETHDVAISDGNPKNAVPSPKKMENVFTKALDEGRRKKRPVLLDFSARWCPGCVRYEKEIFPTAEYKAATKGFVKAVIDTDLLENFAVAERYKIKGIPTMIVVDGDGKEIARLVDFHPLPRLKKFLAAAAEGRQEAADPLAGRFEKAQAAFEADPKTKDAYQKELRALIAAEPDGTRALAWRAELAKTLPDVDAEKKTLVKDGRERAAKWMLDEAAARKAAANDVLGEFTGYERLVVAYYLADLLESGGADEAEVKAVMKQAGGIVKASPVPQEPGPALRSLIVLSSAEMYEDAEKRADELLKRNPGDLDVQRRKIRVLLGLKKNDEAVKLGEKILPQMEGRNQVWTAESLAKAYVAAGRKNDAKRLAQAYLLNPMLSSERMKSSKETLESLAK